MYVELHSRSAFSFLEGASPPEALALTAAGLSMPAMALLDRNGFYGSARFHMAAQKTGIRAHVGTELSIADESGTVNYPLLCESQLGYQNLCRLITRTKLRVPKHSASSAQLSELEEHATGLICLTGDEHGPLVRALRNGGMDAGRDLLNKLISVFGYSNVYVELQRHFHREQEQRNQCAIALAREFNLPLLQIESRAQMASLPRNYPEKFYDLVTQVALIRPGPITGAMTAPYLKRRQKKELVTYPHPSLEPVLKRTLGVPLFQEQLLRMAMVCANFSGGEAEELRRALGSKRSKQKMLEIEARLRNGMTQNGITPKAQDEIVQFIVSFALYGFPESHSASFALIAYASAFLKVRYLAAFTAALLNNQPMGFYSPATLVKDAQRHGLKIKPIDVTCSMWDCSLEKWDGQIGVRIGLRYVRGLQQIAGESLVYARNQRPFSSIEELARRVPELNHRNLRILAEIGALNNICTKLHRRDALWQIEKAGKKVGELLEGIVQQDTASPLAQMDVEERLVSDYHGSSMTTGPHPMFYRRDEMRKLNIKSAAELRDTPHGRKATVAGAVITRQRPGTASGLIFLTMEDETGYSNVIVMPHVYEQYRQAVLQPRFISVSGTVQNQDGIVHLKADRVEALVVSAAQFASHDFH
jgi:error-prone DNA polymerase